MLTHLHELSKRPYSSCAYFKLQYARTCIRMVLARGVKRRKTLLRTVIYEFVEFEFATLRHRVKCFAREFTGGARARSGVMIADGH